MIYSRTHKKDRTIKRTLSLLLAGLMMLGLFGTLPLYGCSGGDTTPVATPGKDALQNATPGSDDAGQPTAEITAEPTPIPETPTPECTDEPSPTPWNPEPTPTPKPAYSYYELYYDILRDRLHRRSSGLRSFHDMESDPEMRVKYENGELWTYDFYTGEKLRQYPEELYQYAYDRLECDDEHGNIHYCYGLENWVAFVKSTINQSENVDESDKVCIFVTDDGWETWREIRFEPEPNIEQRVRDLFRGDAIYSKEAESDNPNEFSFWARYIGIGVSSPDVCIVTVYCCSFIWGHWSGLDLYLTFLTTDGGENWRSIDVLRDGLHDHIRSPYFEGEEGIASDYYVTHDGGRTWAFDEELWSYYRQLRKRGRWISAVLSTDRFTRTDEMRENAIKQ